MSIKDNYSIKKIEKIDYADWLLKKHYAKRIPSISYAYGLYNSENIIVGVCTFGKPVSNNLCEFICGKNYKNQVYELNRLITSDKTKNLTSYFVSKCLKYLPKGLIIVSYSDCGMNHNGYIYQATNFLFTGKTKERTDIFSNGHSRHYDKNIDYSKNRKLRTSKNRYVFFTSNKKKYIKLLKYKILPYPKAENKNYIDDYKPNIQLRLF